MALDLTPLEDAVMQLEEALELYHSDLAQSHPRLGRHLRAPVIQAIEFTYELSFRKSETLPRAGIPQSSGDRQLGVQRGHQGGIPPALVQSDLPVWREYRRNRGTTSHTYNEEKAQEVFESVPDFLQDARHLLNRLQERNEDLDDGY